MRVTIRSHWAIRAGLSLLPIGAGAGGADAICGATWEIPVLDAGTCGAAAGATAAAGITAGIALANSIAGEEAGDEGEQALDESQAREEAECANAPNLGNLERLSEREIERLLNEDGTDIHTDKEDTVREDGAAYDYRRDKSTGEIYLVPKRDLGPGSEAIPTGLGR